MKKYKDHTYADCPEPNRHHKAAHRLIEGVAKMKKVPTAIALLKELKFMYDHKHEMDCQIEKCVWFDVDARIEKGKAK